MDVFLPDAALQAWKRQLDAGFRVIEVLTEGAERMHEAQIEAAVSTHADAVSTQRAAAQAKDVAALLELQLQWGRANTERAMSYWRTMYENAAQTGAELAKCLAQDGEAK